jgi:hypothetical protein
MKNIQFSNKIRKDYLDHRESLRRSNVAEREGLNRLLYEYKRAIQDLPALLEELKEKE